MSLLEPLGAGDRPINRNDLWCRVIVGALADAGVGDALLCPGGRAAMMSMTLGRTPEIVSRVHVDERSAAFLALGLVAAGGRPAVVCTTPGSLTPARRGAVHRLDCHGGIEPHRRRVVARCR